MEKTLVLLTVLKYIVKVVVQIRMAALEKKFKVIPVSVPVHVFHDYLSSSDIDENHSIIAHPEVAEFLHLKSGDWIWIQCNPDGNRTLARLVVYEPVRVNEAIISDTLFYNSTGGTCDAEEVVLSPSLLDRVPYAISFNVSILKCPKGWDASDIDLLMVKFFSHPRVISIGDVFSISVVDYVAELFFSKPVQDDASTDRVWLKVEELVAEAGRTTDEDNRLCFAVSKETTKVALVISKGAGLPSKVDITLGHQTNFLELENAVKLYMDPQLFKILHKGKGLILSGTTGCEELYRAVADSLGLHLVVQDCRKLNLQTGFKGQIEGKIKQMIAQTNSCVPSLLVLENIEVLGHDHESTNTENEDFRLITLLNKVLRTISRGHCAVLGVTSNPKNIIPSISRSWLPASAIPLKYHKDPKACLRQLLARMGLYQKEILVEVPPMAARELRLLARKAVESKFELVAENFERRISGEIKKTDSNYQKVSLGLELQKQHWDKALDSMKTFSVEVKENIPKVYWEDIGGLEEVRKEVLRTIALPIQFPFLRKSGLKRSGILLYGPPGTGKTLVAKAVATECGLSFISVKGAELLSMYVGQSEENIRVVFSRARQVAPSVIFFDELDALAPARGQGGDGGGNVSDRVVSQLMAEMDGIEQNLDPSNEQAPIFVMAATNRVDLVESALLRPGRFDKLMYVGPCKTEVAKVGVLKALTRRYNATADLDFKELAQHLPEVPLTGADLYRMCADAWKSALCQRISLVQQTGLKEKTPVFVSLENFIDAALKMRTSVSLRELALYEQEAQKQNIH